MSIHTSNHSKRLSEMKEFRAYLLLTIYKVQLLTIRLKLFP